MLTALSQHIKSLNTLHQQAQSSRQRRLVVFSGERQWSAQIIAAFLCQNDIDNALWITDAPPSEGNSINNSQARQQLGSEHDALIYDVHSGLDPNALAAVTGTLRGGGLLLLMVPELATWSQHINPDYQRLLVYPFQLQQLSQRFMQRIKTSLMDAPSCLIIEQCDTERCDGITSHQTVDEQKDTDRAVAADVVANVVANIAANNDGACSAVIMSSASAGNKSDAVPTHTDYAIVGLDKSVSALCYTREQATAVAAICKVYTGHRRRPLVITSDRGRGKSSALGIASAYLMQQKTVSIIVTAPARRNVQALFERAAQIVDGSLRVVNVLHHQRSSMTFIAPDELLTQQPNADLLLVDEAAAIPAAMLEQMLRRYSRIVFATTVHGYEGTGRGFAIRFKQCLDVITPQWKSLTLCEPIRWASGDPVERWLFAALLLDAQSNNTIDAADIKLSQCTVEVVDRDQLLAEADTLESLFSLLINAHYQTSPSDLRNILDGPNINVWVTRYQGHIIAAALVAEEGRFDQPLSSAVWKGQRRVQGHLLPQTLAAHSGWHNAPTLSYWRVMRIAVEPALQRLGIGRELLQTIIHRARDAKIDMVGSSFAATADVMAFWCNMHCVPVRVGLSKDPCSGVPSSVVLYALSTAAQHFLVPAHQRFIEQLRYGLSSIYRDLSPALVVALLAGGVTEHGSSELNQQDWLDINSFIEGLRQYELCQLALYRFACAVLARIDRSHCINDSPIDDLQAVLLVKLLLQHHDVKQVAGLLALTGKKQLINTLRDTVKTLSRVYLLSSK